MTQFNTPEGDTLKQLCMMWRRRGVYSIDGGDDFTRLMDFLANPPDGIDPADTAQEIPAIKNLSRLAAVGTDMPPSGMESAPDAVINYVSDLCAALKEAVRIAETENRKHIDVAVAKNAAERDLARVNAEFSTFRNAPVAPEEDGAYDAATTIAHLKAQVRDLGAGFETAINQRDSIQAERDTLRDTLLHRDREKAQILLEIGTMGDAAVETHRKLAPDDAHFVALGDYEAISKARDEALSDAGRLERDNIALRAENAAVWKTLETLAPRLEAAEVASLKSRVDILETSDQETSQAFAEVVGALRQLGWTEDPVMHGTRRHLKRGESA